MKSAVVKRSIVIAGHKTSVSLEDAFWKGLKDIASGQLGKSFFRGDTVSELIMHRGPISAEIGGRN